MVCRCNMGLEDVEDIGDQFDDGKDVTESGGFEDRTRRLDARDGGPDGCAELGDRDKWLGTVNEKPTGSGDELPSWGEL
jgi:hypothetical protein